MFSFVVFFKRQIKQTLSPISLGFKCIHLNNDNDTGEKKMGLVEEICSHPQKKRVKDNAYMISEKHGNEPWT